MNESSRPDRKRRVQEWVSIATTVVAIISAMISTLTWRDNASLGRARAELDWQSAYTDRYDKATEELGSASVTVRLGAVYSFEDLVRDFPKERISVVNVLTSFVRHSVNIRPDARLSDKAPTDGAEPLPIDLAGALRAVSGLIGPKGPENHLDLSKTNLSGLDLSGMNLAYADFSMADLRGADLSNADLEGAEFVQADLVDASLEGARLVGAGFSFVNDQALDAEASDGAAMTQTDLSYADLRGAGFSYSNLKGSYMNAADLSEVEIDDSGMEYARFDGANLASANFVCTDVEHASFVMSNVAQSTLQLSGNGHIDEYDLKPSDLAPDEYSGCGA